MIALFSFAGLEGVRCAREIYFYSACFGCYALYLISWKSRNKTDDGYVTFFCFCRKVSNNLIFFVIAAGSMYVYYHLPSCNV